MVFCEADSSSVEHLKRRATHFGASRSHCLVLGEMLPLDYSAFRDAPETRAQALEGLLI